MGLRATGTIRWLAPAVVLALAGSLGFAALASSTVPDSNAGQGDGAIQGYRIYNIHYGFDHTPKILGSVSFLIEPVPKVVKVSFGNGKGKVYYDDDHNGTSSHCGLTDLGNGTASVNCNNLAEPIGAVDSLEVTASQ